MKQALEDVETAVRGTHPVEDNSVITHKVEVPKASWKDFWRHFSKWQNGKVLIGTAWSWFALDVRVLLRLRLLTTNPSLQIAFYGLGLNSSIILSTIGFGTPGDSGSLKVYRNLMNICVGNLILSVAGLIPGYWVTFALVDIWGRKPIQFMGFTMLTILFVIMGFGYDKLTSTSGGTKAFVFLYCLANFFQNFGPNTTTFIVPGEVFPTRYRSTAHGISAASGKLGAIVAQVGFAQLRNIGGPNKFVNHM